MKTTDWYSRIMLTAIVGLLLVVALELRVSNQLASAGQHPADPAESQETAGYRPTAVALRTPASASTEVLNVRIVGYRYKQDGGPGRQATYESIELGDKPWGHAGIPVITKSE